MDKVDPVEILLVEDNPRDAELTIRALKKNNLANHLVHVQDGIDALDFLFAKGEYEGRTGHNLPKVVLLDLKLPKLNGLEVLRILRQDVRTCTLAIVVITSSAEDPDIKSAYELGANSYVIKPVNFDSFLEAMGHLGVYWLLVNKPLKVRPITNGKEMYE
ncbi:MAG: response regulator [Anaerolineales bacterium]|nr:response regulator [Anaerolineales bacterium]